MDLKVTVSKNETHYTLYENPKKDSELTLSQIIENLREAKAKSEHYFNGVLADGINIIIIVKYTYIITINK